MGKEKIIVAVGTSEEATAHLRLLIRQASAQLNHKWVWGAEVSADLVVVDPDAFAGQMARTRCQSSGVRCAVIADEDGDAPADALWLKKPLRLANVVEVMNKAGELAIRTVDVDAHGADFYFKDLDDFKAPDSPHVAPDPWAEKRRTTLGGAAPATPGLDEMIKGDPLAEAPKKTALPSSLDDVTIEATEGPTRRSESKADSHIAKSGGVLVTDEMGPNVLPSAKAKLQSEGERNPLGAYLAGNLLTGPNSLKLDDAPTLVLDPKNSMFYAEGSLAALEPYAKEPIAKSAWKRMTTAEMTQATKIPGRPYAQLRWLETLSQATGRLSPKLDPGGTYRIKERIDIEPAFHDHGAIADAMVELARLNEIMAASKTSMEKVFDVVNAYDAIGALESQARARLRGDTPEQKPTGLFGKIKSVFTKS